MAVIAVRSPFDVVLSVVAPLGLAVHKGTALVVDLDPSSTWIRGEADLASLVRRGPTESQLQPRRPGVAVLANGGVTVPAAADVVNALARRWPNLVLRCASDAASSRSVLAIVPVLPEPFDLDLDVGGDVVYQQTGLGGGTRAGSLVLPVPRPSTIRSLLSGRVPVRMDPWIRSLGRVWAMA
jgi:hypothetical protein